MRRAFPFPRLLLVQVALEYGLETFIAAREKHHVVRRYSRSSSVSMRDVCKRTAIATAEVLGDTLTLRSFPNRR